MAEIAGCFAFWAWLRQGKSALWLVPGIVCLAVFALLLTRADAAFAGRAHGRALHIPEVERCIQRQIALRVQEAGRSIGHHQKLVSS